MVLALVVGAGAAWFYRTPLKREFNDWRAERLVTQSKESAAAGDWVSAQRQAMEAHEMAPLLYAPREALFRASLQTKGPYLAAAALSLKSHPDAPDETKLEALSAVVRFAPVQAFPYLYRQLPMALREREETVLIVIDYLLRTDQAAEARQLIEARQAKIPEAASDRRINGKLVTALLREEPAQTQAERLEADRIAHGLVTELDLAPQGTRDDLFLAALEQVASLPLSRVHPDLLPSDAAVWLARHPEAPIPTRLLAERIRLAAQRTDPLGNFNAPMEAHLKSVIQNYRESEPEALCAWLFDLGRTMEILEICDEKQARENAALFWWRFRALERLPTDRLEEALSWLNPAPPTVDPGDRLVAQAAIQVRLGQRPEALKSWEELLFLADADPARYPASKYFPLAVSQGLIDAGARLIVNAASHPGAQLPPSETLTPVLTYLRENGRLEVLQSLTANLLRSEPWNLSWRNNYAYLCFLTGLDTAEALKMAQDLVQTQPDVLTFRTTVALGHLVMGQPAPAVQVLAQPGLNWELASPADHAIRSASLERAGRSIEAAEARKRFALNELPAAERRLLFPRD